MTSFPPLDGPALTVPELERWRLFGATWRVVEIDDQFAVLDLCTCTGELVERRGARDPAVVRYVRASVGDDGQ